MTQSNGRKRVFVTLDEWKNIENAARFQEAETILDKLPIQPKAAISQPEIMSKPLHDFIHRTRMVLRKEEVLPIDLKRAIFLSDVFTEKENHRKFTKILQKIRLERKKKEDERILNEHNERLATQEENSKKISQDKLLLGRRLKDEICLMKKLTKEQRCRQIEAEKEEHMRMKKERAEIEEKQKLAELQRKTELRKLWEDDLRCKLEERKNVEKEEKENRNFDCQFTLTRNDSVKELYDKMVKRKTKNVRSLPNSVSGKMKSKPHHLEIWSQPPSKSEIEKKRELYDKKLKEERIIMYQDQIRELLTRKEKENCQKHVECAQRIQNLEITNSFLSQRNRNYLESVNQNRHIWSQQCREQKLKQENEKLEDVRRLQKLKDDMQKEDEKYLKDIYAAWRKCKNTGKNAFPILKCIREFTKRRNMCNISVPFEE